MAARTNWRPPQGTITKSVAMTPTLADRVSQEAASEGHYNFSAMVVKALTEYFARHAAPDEVAPVAASEERVA